MSNGTDSGGEDQATTRTGLGKVNYNKQGYPIRLNAPECPNYLTKGSCAFRRTCKFNHPEIDSVTPGSSQPVGLHPDKPICQNLIKFGSCRKVKTCPYHHPPDAGTGETTGKKSPSMDPEEISDLLHDWIKSCGGEVMMSDLSRFYAKYPEVLPEMSGNASAIINQFPNKFVLIKGNALGLLYLRSMDYVEPVPIDIASLRKKTVSSSSSIEKKHTPEELVNMLHEWVVSRGGKVLMSELIKFYTKYPETISELSGGQALPIINDYPGKLQIIRGSSEGAVFLQAIDEKEQLQLNQDQQQNSTSKKKPKQANSSVDLFDPQVLGILIKYMVEKHNGRMLGSDFGAFYKTYPELNAAFTGKISALAENCPHLFTFKQNHGNDWIEFVGDQQEFFANQQIDDNKKILPPMKPQLTQYSTRTDVDDLTQRAIVAFGEYLRENGPLSSTFLLRFYKKHLEFTGVFSGKMKILSQLFPECFTMETNSDNGFTIFHPVDPSSVKLPANVIVTKRQINGMYYTDNAEVVLETLKSWIPLQKLALDVEGDSKNGNLSLIEISGNPGDTLVIDVLLHGNPEQFLRSCGLFEILEDEEVIKVCHGSERVASLLYRNTNCALKGTWDTKASGLLLCPGLEEPSLGDLMDDYGVKVTADKEGCLTEVKDWFKRPLSANQLKWATRAVQYSLDLETRMRDDAYSRDMVEICLEASKSMTNEGLSTGYMQSESARLLRDPTTKKSILETGSLSALQSFKTKSASAKRVEGLKAKQLPLNACYHFHIASPGFCPNKNCSFAHDL